MHKINGVLIKSPPGDNFDIENYNITKAERNADGEMIMELIAKKRKFYFTYPELSGSDLETILDIIDSGDVFFELEYPDNGVQKTATVYAGPIRRKKLRSHMGWYWKDVTFNLIER